MRRCIQTVVLYEANRCLEKRYSVLRPFQRKVALFDAARDIINTLDFIPSYQRAEIMYRTAKTKIPLSPDLTWQRMKVIDREVKKIIVPKIKPLFDENKTHEEICNEYIQSEYESHKVGVKGLFIVYRMYYVGEHVNEYIPPSCDPNPNRVVPVKRPPLGSYPGELVDFPLKLPSSSCRGERRLFENNEVERQDKDSSLASMSEVEKRRLVLKEVREHLELLKEFEGVISTEQLNQRKKELFSALPPAPDD